MNIKSILSAWCLTALMAMFAVLPTASATNRAELERDSRLALNALLANVPQARVLSEKAIAVLVFPKVTKAGLMVGGQYGDGVLWQNDKVVGFYNTAGASFGLQAGAQQFGYALFFMKESALGALTRAEGFEVGVGPSVVVMDQGMSYQKSTTTYQDDIYAFIFGQKGLMAGIGIQGNKLTKINP